MVESSFLARPGPALRTTKRSKLDSVSTSGASSWLESLLHVLRIQPAIPITGALRGAPGCILMPNRGDLDMTTATRFTFCFFAAAACILPQGGESTEILGIVEDSSG